MNPLADFEPQDIREAWQIKAGGLPFGFEFVSRVVFRDVNFGELSKPGETFKVADKENARPGFQLCRHCGKVQKPPKNRNDPPGQLHVFDCAKNGNDDPSNLLECLYLYREFESEALRILVPYTRSGVDDEVIQSFMAALQLGLKNRFGGKVEDASSQGSVPAQPSQMALAQEWQAVLDQSMASLTQGISQLSSAQILPPLVGHELADAAGKVVADSELARPKGLLVVLRSDQQDLESAWQVSGWQVVLLDEDGLSINGQPWHEVVLANLQR